MTQFYLVGQIKDAGDFPRWEFQGCFTTRELAIAACRDERYFVAGPFTPDESLPHETLDPADYASFFPLAKEAL